MKAVASGKLPMMPVMPARSLHRSRRSRACQRIRDGPLGGRHVDVRQACHDRPGTTGGDGIVEATFRKMVDPRSWIGGTGEMDDVLGRMAEGPRFADLWEAERRYAGVLQAWMNLRRRSLEHNAVVLEAWLQAARRFTEQLAARAGPDAKPSTRRPRWRCGRKPPISNCWKPSDPSRSCRRRRP